MRKELKLFLIFLLIYLFSNKITSSEEKKFNYDYHKKLLIKKTSIKLFQKVSIIY